MPYGRSSAIEGLVSSSLSLSSLSEVRPPNKCIVLRVPIRGLHVWDPFLWISYFCLPPPSPLFNFGPRIWGQSFSPSFLPLILCLLAAEYLLTLSARQERRNPLTKLSGYIVRPPAFSTIHPSCDRWYPNRRWWEADCTTNMLLLQRTTSPLPREIPPHSVLQLRSPIDHNLVTTSNFTSFGDREAIDLHSNHTSTPLFEPTTAPSAIMESSWVGNRWGRH